jgi:hypothetical protein
VDEPGAVGGAGARDIGCPGGVDGVRTGLVGLGDIDRGQGGTVDHHVTGGDDRGAGRRVGDVPLRRRAREQIAPLGGEFTAQESADLPARAGDDDSGRHNRYPASTPAATFGCQSEVSSAP